MADWNNFAPFMVEGHPPMWISRAAMADPENAESYVFEDKLYWIEKTAWSSGPVGSFTVTAEGRDNVKVAEDMVASINSLVAKAKNLVALLDDAEVNHGSLIGGVTLRAIGELRLELAKWK